MKKLNTEELINKAREIHGNKYDYSKTIYHGYYEKVCIICPKHGEFWKSPSNHINKSHSEGCPLCEKEKKTYNQLDTNKFIKLAREVHGAKYDYSKVVYKNNHTKVSIICPEHGEFLQLPSNHLSGKGCKKCGYSSSSQKQKLKLEEFINKAIEVHGNKYDYSKVNYTNNRTKISIVCPKHGEFTQTPDSHLSGRGCQKCKSEKISSVRVKRWDVILNEMKKIHKEKYSYDESTYIDARHKIKITCPQHGEFWQVAFGHANGCGCPKCASSKIENEIGLALTEHNINHNIEQKFSWLFYISQQKLDFYLPDYNIAIECQGAQHFKPISFFSDDKENFNIRLERDKTKKRLCEENGVRLYYFSHESYDEFLGEKVYHNKEELINEILKHTKK